MDLRGIKCCPVAEVTIQTIRNEVSPSGLNNQTTQGDQTNPEESKPVCVCVCPKIDKKITQTSDATAGWSESDGARLSESGSANWTESTGDALYTV